ncbi:MAG: aminopeptidase [Phycisphaeraceae bacterium]|nr:MAG: aminopeptidase [Phycisphaeraceae bacterium]
MRDPRHDKLADVLVRYSAHVKKGDVVAIMGDPVAMPLIKAVYERVLQEGAHPYWSVRSQELLDSFYAHANDDQLGFESPIVMHEAETVDCFIRFITDLNTRSLTRVDPGKSMLVSRARKPSLLKSLNRASEGDLSWVLTQCPTLAAAQDAEMSLDEYEDFVFRAGMLHLEDPVAAWKQVRERQELLREWLQGKKEIHFRRPGPDGSSDTSQGATDLKVSVDGGTWINCFGDNNFPDGEVFCGPQGVEGVVNYNFPAVYNGREVDGVRLVFRGGRVVEASATKNEAFLHSMLDQDEGARGLGEIAIGTNYQIQDFTRNTLFDEKIGGTFHAAVGAGYPDSGSTNESGLHWDMVCDMRKTANGGGGEISADGEVFHRDGRFLTEGWPG